jgi:uncharacterized protein (DUF1684 family)
MPIEVFQMTVYSRRAIFATLASLSGAFVCPAVPVGESYEQSVLRNREQADEHFKGANGPLTLVARFSPREGTSTLGKDPTCSLVLSDATAPPRMGEVTVKGGKAILRFASAVQAEVDGKRVTFIETDSKSARVTAANIGLLKVRLYFIRGEQLQISVSNPNWILRKEAQPLAWFSVDKKYRVIADWIEYAKPKMVFVPDNDGSSRERTIPGYVTFTIDGLKLRLTPILRPGNPNPFFVFGDTTNNHETYGAGRFLEANPPQNGKIILDFNKAYNPLCAYNHEFLCPIAPKENRLRISIRAGERKYPGNHTS